MSCGTTLLALPGTAAGRLIAVRVGCSDEHHFSEQEKDRGRVVCVRVCVVVVVCVGGWGGGDGGGGGGEVVRAGGLWDENL